MGVSPPPPHSFVALHWRYFINILFMFSFHVVFTEPLARFWCWEKCFQPKFPSQCVLLTSYHHRTVKNTVTYMPTNQLQIGISFSPKLSGGLVTIISCFSLAQSSNSMSHPTLPSSAFFLGMPTCQDLS